MSKADETRLALEQRLTLYRCAQEALTNIRKHANATRVLLRLRVDGRWRSSSHWITDSGASSGERDAPGFGLLGIRERIALLGGTSSHRGQSQARAGVCRSRCRSGGMRRQRVEQRLATRERWSMGMPLQPSDDAPVRVLLVDDQTLLRQGFQRLLELSDNRVRSSARRRMAWRRWR